MVKCQAKCPKGLLNDRLKKMGLERLIAAMEPDGE